MSAMGEMMGLCVMELAPGLWHPLLRMMVRPVITARTARTAGSVARGITYSPWPAATIKGTKAISCCAVHLALCISPEHLVLCISGCCCASQLAQSHNLQLCRQQVRSNTSVAPAILSLATLSIGWMVECR